MSNRMMGILDELGILCDLTLEPGHGAVRTLSPTDRMTGWIPNYRGVPQAPYRPSRWNYKREGRRRPRNIWVLPVSTGRPHGEIAGLPYPAPRRLTMILGFPFPALRQILEQRLDNARPHVVALARTDVTLNPSTREQLDLFFDHLIEHPLRERFVFGTPLETLGRLANQESATNGNQSL